jgi:protein-S-isoprenylcysteine O-methyltransferase Ste14
VRRTIEAIVATIAVPGTAVFLVPYLILVRTQQVSPGRVGVLEAFSLGIALVGAGMVVWVSYAFVTRGKGTPVPIDPPRRFVADGLFRYVRNPMYVGALLVLLGEALLFRSTWIVLYAAGLWLLLHTFLVLFEEPQLRRRFGGSYGIYVASTPRWIPHLPRPGRVRRATRK